MVVYELLKLDLEIPAISRHDLTAESKRLRLSACEESSAQAALDRGCVSGASNRVNPASRGTALPAIRPRCRSAWTAHEMCLPPAACERSLVQGPGSQRGHCVHGDILDLQISVDCAIASSTFQAVPAHRFDQRLGLCGASSFRLIPLCIQSITIEHFCWRIGEVPVVELAGSAKILAHFFLADRCAN